MWCILKMNAVILAMTWVGGLCLSDIRQVLEVMAMMLAIQLVMLPLEIALLVWGDPDREGLFGRKP